MELSRLKILIIVIISLAVNSLIAEEYKRINLEDGGLLEFSTNKLNPDEGYLIFDIDTDFEIKRVELKRSGSMFNHFVIHSVKGRSLHVVRLKAGEYYFSQLKLPQRIHYNLDKTYNFKVEPGVINYPGAFVVESINYIWQAEITIKNRLFKFIEEYRPYLQEYYPGVSLIYNGSYKDLMAEEVELCCE